MRERCALGFERQNWCCGLFSTTPDLRAVPANAGSRQWGQQILDFADVCCIRPQMPRLSLTSNSAVAKTRPRVVRGARSAATWNASPLRGKLLGRRRASGGTRSIKRCSGAAKKSRAIGFLEPTTGRPGPRLCPPEPSAPSCFFFFFFFFFFFLFFYTVIWFFLFFLAFPRPPFWWLPVAGGPWTRSSLQHFDVRPSLSGSILPRLTRVFFLWFFGWPFPHLDVTMVSAAPKEPFDADGANSSCHLSSASFLGLLHHGLQFYRAIFNGIPPPNSVILFNSHSAAPGALGKTSLETF